MPWFKVADINDVPPSSLRKVQAGGKNICLVNDNGQYFAVAATCPHAGADLSKGWCNNGQLVCPFHRYTYNLSTGRGAPGQNDYVTTYTVEVRNDGVYVNITSLLSSIRNLFK
jgi:nitrite reductase/ring-hydroxylating ferredoxin subunit